MHLKPTTRRPAFSAAEILISTVIVGIMIAAALEATGMVYRTRRFNIERLTGQGLARELMAEIMSMPYADPDGGSLLGIDLSELLSSRATYDDVDDYNGYSAANAENKQGAALPGYTGWRQQAQVGFVSRADAATGSLFDTGLKRITVTITSPSGKQTELTALRSSAGLLEQTTPLALNAISWIDAELRVGSSTRSERAAAPPANLTADPN